MGKSKLLFNGLYQRKKSILPKGVGYEKETL